MYISFAFGGVEIPEKKLNETNYNLVKEFAINFLATTTGNFAITSPNINIVVLRDLPYEISEKPQIFAVKKEILKAFKGKRWLVMFTPWNNDPLIMGDARVPLVFKEHTPELAIDN